MKIKVKDRNFGAFRNEIVKRRTFKLLVREPLKHTVYPKPSGVIIKSDSDTTIHKRDAVEGVRLKNNPDTFIYKHNDGVVFDPLYDSFGVQYNLLGEYYTVTTVDEPFSYKTEISSRISSASPQITSYNQNNSSILRYYNNTVEYNPPLNPAIEEAYWAVNQYNATSILHGLTLNGIVQPYLAQYVTTGEGPNGTKYLLDHFANGALITPKHSICTSHGNYYPMIGQVIRFLTDDNTILEATVAKRSALLGADLSLVEFEDDVDEAITPFKILMQYGITPEGPHPIITVLPNQRSYIFPVQYLSAIGTNKGIVPTTAAENAPYYNLFSDTSRGIISGDSGSACIVVYKNSTGTIVEPLLLGCLNIWGVGSGTKPTAQSGLGGWLSTIRNKILEWGNTDPKYKLKVFYNKYTRGNDPINIDYDPILEEDPINP